MKKFSQLRDDRSVKTPHAQRMANLLPLWSLPRVDETANMHTLLGDVSGEVSDVSLTASDIIRNATATSVDLFTQGSVYIHVVDPSFVWEYEDLKGVIRYIAPTVVGYRGVSGYQMQLVKDGDPDLLFLSVPSATEAAVLIYDVSELPSPLQYTGGAASLSHTEIKIPVDSQVSIEVDASDPTGININGKFYNGNLRLRNVRRPRIEYNFPVLSNGIYRYTYPITAGTYEVITEILTDDVTLTIDVWGFSSIIQEYGWRYFTPIAAESLFYRISEEDPSYLEYITPPVGGILAKIDNGNETYITHKAAVLLGEDNNSHEAKYIAKTNMNPWLLALSNEEDNVMHIYDTYLDQPYDVKVDNADPVLSIHTEPYDWRLGDEIMIKTRREAAFMDERVKGIRLKVYEKETDSTYYIDRSGAIVANPNNAWVQTNTTLGTWKEQRWRFTLGVRGTHIFTLEALLVGGNDSVKAAELTIHIPYKTPIGKLTIDMPAGRTLEKISFFTDGQLYGVDDLGSLYQIPLLYNNFYIDYDAYTIYTLSEFDYLDLEYV